MDHPEPENKLASVDEGSRLCAGHLKAVPSSNEEMCPRSMGSLAIPAKSDEDWRQYEVLGSTPGGVS